LILVIELAMQPTRYEFSCVAYVKPSTFGDFAPLNGAPVTS
jgi:hypothetical protein